MFRTNLKWWYFYYYWVYLIIIKLWFLWDDGAQSSPLPVKPSLQASETLFDLNSWIKHYDVASYDQRNFLQFHHEHRIRRSNHNNNNTRIIKLEVNGQNRIFKLLLKPDDSIFANDVIIESTRNPQLNFNTEITYSGTLADDESAEVHGIITQNGLFEGTIHTGNEDYHIEPISRYLNNSIIKKEPLFHSIIYKTSDINERLLNDKQNKYSSCASEKLRKKRWLLQADAKSPYYGDLILFNGTSRKSYGSWDDSSINSQPIDEILELDNNRTSVDASALIFKNVYKRATIDPKKTTCMLYLQADHQFFQKYGTEEACIEVMTRHVQRVNSIYKNTDFNQDGKKDNITFMVKRIKVHTLEAVKDPQYRFPNNYGVEKFLELFSEEDYDAFCLAYMFTYRDFEMGTLGLAWTGDLKNAGGVCEKNGHYRGSMKSLNTGIVTLLNYGKHVPPAVSHVTLAHEIGHNFGSPHDPEQCTPGGEDGNYIMFARATSGDKKNNNKFSPCSLKSINPVLNYKARSAKGCFTEPKGAICGNGVVEDGEECDCGWEEDCRDQCCFPMRRYAPIDEIPCSLTPKSVCSPSQGPCCTVDCQMKFGDKCREDNGCRDESFCNGKLAQCPLSVNKPNKTICNKEFVCFMGECTGSICLAYGLESCQCIPEIGDIKTKACELCCRLPGDNQPCKSSFEWNDMPFDVPDMFSKPGTPCNDYSGYCDVFQMCREVDPSGPLATLRKLLLSDESIASFKKWIMDYWYAVAAILTTIISLLILSTRYFGKRPSLNKLKSITIMHKQTAETVRLPPDNLQDGVIIHQGIRSKVPLKKRVRNGKIKSRSRKNITGKIINNNNNNTKKKTLNEINTTTGTDGTGTNNNNLKNSPKKSSPRKKKRLSAAVEDGNNKKNSSVEIPHSKVKKMSLKPKKLKMKKKKMEIIDYSSIKPDIDGKNDTATTIIKPIAVHSAIIQEELLSTSDSVGKVHHWLKTQYNLPKSKSSPSGLSKPALKSRSSRPNNIKNKSRSVANIPSSNNNNNNNEIKDKVRLQVVYKPPFKFSLKLRKPEKLPENNNVKKTNNNKAIRTAILVQHHHHQLPKSSKITDLPSLSSIPINDVAGTSLSKPAAYDTINLSTDNATDNNNINLNVHTVQSDLDVLLSDDEEEEEEEEENDYISVDDDNDE